MLAIIGVITSILKVNGSMTYAVNRHLSLFKIEQPKKLFFSVSNFGIIYLWYIQLVDSKRIEKVIVLGYYILHALFILPHAIYSIFHTNLQNRSK